MQSGLTPVQDPVVWQQARGEAIGVFVLYGGAALALKLLDVNLDTALLTMLVLGVTWITGLKVSCTMTHNVHLAEIRDLLEKQNRIAEIRDLLEKQNRIAEIRDLLEKQNRTLDQWRQEQPRGKVRD